ncbi:unnamed protein product [Rotaria sp. Silwood1]|nr:unnamed protein product [Rotaria sp. Silwood1]
MLPQDEALKILTEFLQHYGYTKVVKIYLNTIGELATIVLKENVFAYGNKIYQQILASAMSSSFTLTLANILMWNWQQKLVDQQEKTGEFLVATEPSFIPFTSDHPQHVFGNIIQSSLARAVRYSSTFEAFQNEQRYIEFMLLYNG